MNIEIKKILSEDVWPIRQEVMYPNDTLESIKLPKDNIGKHFGLFDEDGLASIVSVFVENKKMQFRKLATINNKQRRGYASMLLDYIFEKAGEYEIELIWCNARVQKIAFYEKFRMCTTDKKYTRNEIDYIVMMKGYN